MPTTKSAVDAAATKKKKTSKSKDVKEKKEKSSATSSSKDRSGKKESSKKKKSATADDRDKAKATTTPSDATAPSMADQQYHPDAVQLFRRYDRARTGALLRSDFLQLLRDYAQPPLHPHVHQQHQRPSVRFLVPRQPLSLTDSQGIPLGYERSDKNSEFEAGQLFERYDKDHVGTLSLDKFHVFFNDFRTQLTGFVDDLTYASSHVAAPTVSLPEASPSAVNEASLTAATAIPAAAATVSSDGDQPTEVATARTESSIRALYQSALWELRKICKDELQQQRDRVLAAMDRLRARMTRTSHNTRVMRTAGSPRATRWGENQLTDRYDALESDSERLDEILRRTRRQLRKGTDVSSLEMETFLMHAPELLADARELAMNVYDNHDHDHDHDARESQPLRRVLQEDQPLPQGTEEKETPSKDKMGSSSRGSSSTATPPLPSESVDALQKTLRVKDQIIYQLLQERTTLRKQKNQAETDLHELTEMSTHEMHKWARLTDDMQAEITRLRERLHE